MKKISRRSLILLTTGMSVFGRNREETPASPTDQFRIFSFKECWNAWTEKAFYTVDAKDQAGKVKRLWQKVWSSWWGMF